MLICYIMRWALCDGIRLTDVVQHRGRLIMIYQCLYPRTLGSFTLRKKTSRIPLGLQVYPRTDYHSPLLQAAACAPSQKSPRGHHIVEHVFIFAANTYPLVANKLTQSYACPLRHSQKFGRRWIVCTERPPCDSRVRSAAAGFPRPGF